MTRVLFLDDVADADLPTLLASTPEPEARALVRDELNARSLSPQPFATVPPTENPENPMSAAKIEAVPAVETPPVPAAPPLAVREDGPFAGIPDPNVHLWGERLGPLVNEYDAWCVANSFPHVSADEQDLSGATAEQRAWIEDFIARWDAAQEADDAAPAPAAEVSQLDPPGGRPMNAPFNPDDHNPDLGPGWIPLVGRRVLACETCGAETVAQTNHTGTVPAERCVGRCRTILNAHTAREIVQPFYGPHRYVREAEG